MTKTAQPTSHDMTADNAAANAAAANPTENGKGPRSYEITMVEPIERGDLTIGKVTLRRPKAGDLRGGLDLAKIQNCDVEAILAIIPRISNPGLTDDDCENLDPEDLMEMGGAIRGFFMTKPEREMIERMKAQAK